MQLRIPFWVIKVNFLLINITTLPIFPKLDCLGVSQPTILKTIVNKRRTLETRTCGNYLNPVQNDSLRTRF